MISLLAAAFEDGWAFVRQGYTIYLVRPPYQKRDLVEVNEATVERAIHAHGFAPELLPFQDWSALIDFLRERIVSTSRARAERASETKAAALLLRNATPAVLEGYLDRVEHELLPSLDLDAALRLLCAMSGLENVASEPALRDRTASLLERVVERMDEARAARASAALVSALVSEDPAKIARSFPLAAERYGSGLLPYIRAVRERRSLIAIGE
ncbi:MAG TPA: hypothetical protein VK459_25635 [Polyangiaceae bacterium]|jgi:hypothetical protein|nr:hypothetical protein [Polyangiaceae bacterium]